MRRRLLVTLLVCVTLLAQFGASIAGGSASKDGSAAAIRCRSHALAARSASADSSPARRAGGDADPVRHDHASCGLCPLGVGEAPIETAASPPRAAEVYWRIAITKSEAPVLGSALNRSAPARAPPSRL